MPLPLRGTNRRRVALLLLGLAMSLAVLAAVCQRGEAAPTAAVQAHLLWSRYDAADVDAQMDRAKAIGAGMLRVDVGWSSLERDGKGRYESWYLSKIDNVVAKADARGLKLLFTFWETPCWASVAPEDLKQGCAGAWWERRVQRYGPANPADYGDALAFLVKRYGSRVAAWEVWNEPNHPDYFIADDQAKSYAEIVKAAYPAAKAADPSSTIIAGSLADADFGFTERLFGHGIKGKFDAYSVHPYSGDRSPLDPGDDRWIQNSFIRGVPRVRETLLAHGEDKPLWLTEFGWSTCTIRGLQSYKNCVDAPVQASYLKQAYGQMQQWSYVPVGVWFNIEDTSADLADRVDNYGLHTVDGRQKPSATAFREVSEAFGGGAPVAYDRPGTTAPTKPKPGNSGSNGIKSVKKGAVDLTVTRRRGKVVARGGAAVGTRLVLRAYRFRGKRRGYARRNSYTRVVRVGRTGKFNVRLRHRALRKGRWQIVGRTTKVARVTRVARIIR